MNSRRSNRISISNQVTVCCCILSGLFLLSCQSRSDIEKAQILVKKEKIKKEAIKLKEKKKKELVAEKTGKTPDASPTPSSSPGDSGKKDQNVPPEAPEQEKIVSEIKPPASPSPETTPLLLTILNELPAESKELVENLPAAQSTHEFFTNEDLAELSQREPGSSGRSDLISGVVSRVSNAVNPLPPEKESKAKKRSDSEQNDNAEPESNFEFVSGQARGYVMLNLMLPQARKTVERQVQAMLDSKLKELYLGVLTDGTFGKDFNYLSLIVRRLSFGRRELTLALYLTNGATMRSYDVTNINAGFNKINPARFRQLIQFDQSTRARFIRMVKEVKPIFELNRRLNSRNKNIAVVMLEDNLDFESYLAMRQMAKSVLGNLAVFVRNPCPNCLRGNDTKSGGDPIELHNFHEMGLLSKGDGYTLDGESYRFPDENAAGGIPVEDLKDAAILAKDRGLRYFGLWRAERQGLGGSIAIHPRDRHYEVPTDAQLKVEMEILRAGL